MPVALGATPGQFNDLKATGVMYVRASDSSLGAGHFVLPACFLIIISPTLTVNINVLQAAIAKASPSQLLSIPQLPAGILTSAEEEMMISMTRKGGGTEQNLQDHKNKLQAAKAQLERQNEALKNAGSLRTSFDKSVDRALGFDVAKAVAVLKVPPADRTGSTVCPQGTVYCASLKRCISVTQKCA